MTTVDRQQLKDLRRAAKQAHRLARESTNSTPAVCRDDSAVDCACVIHSNGYNWDYVDKLYNMLCRNISRPVRMHVYTEHDRAVPDHMIKHVLDEWPGVSGPKLSWWYKIQLFNPAHHSGQMLYFDLDTVIVGNLDWIFDLPAQYFWAVRDFRHLWKPAHQGINSSVMYWNTENFSAIWQDFVNRNISQLVRMYPGDQDYIGSKLDVKKRRFFDDGRAISWRWQALDGGMSFKTRTYKTPGSGTSIRPNTSVLVFHGRPKPDQIQDPAIQQWWR